MKRILTILTLAIVACSALYAQKNQWLATNDSQISLAWTNTLDGSLMDNYGNYLVKPFRVSLSATITNQIETIWVLESITSQALTALTNPTNSINAVYRATGYNERGITYSNTIATVMWKGKPVTFPLECVQISKTNRTRWE